MNSKTLAIFTRTPLHVGAGSSVSAVDQPVQRERHTGHPVIPGSSIKGVMRAHFSSRASDQVDELFGPDVSSLEDSAAGALASLRPPGPISSSLSQGSLRAGHLLACHEPLPSGRRSGHKVARSS